MENMTYRAILERLETLGRSPEQDMVIRRLLESGMDIQTLDVAITKRVSAGEQFRPNERHLILRDRREMRWVIDRGGKMSVSGRTSWEIQP